MSAVASRWISVAGGTTLLVFGTVGAILNIVIFTDQSLRHCSYSWYLITASFFDLVTLDHALLLRVLADGFGIDLPSTSTVYCRARFYTGQLASFAPITLVCIAATDRWASTCRSVRIRRWSSIRVARYSIVLTVVTWALISLPNLFVYRVSNGVCGFASNTYSDYMAFFLNPILYGLLPVSVLAAFGFATYVNVRKVTRRQQSNRVKVEFQLSKGLILHCGSFVLSQGPYTLWNLYLTFTRSQIKSEYRTSLETLFTQFTRLIFYFNYVSPFYIYCIASTHVRNLTKYYLLFILGRRGPVDPRVHPITNTNAISKSLGRTATNAFAISHAQR